ncbi:uncharacterized protein LOC126481391 [Schistocerca serialis cubense]|uniref:uncharacterized protein LOC126481391 n=1 Tax=Schistocerca serialis cubense TaxID=2023355 RepID=UPI00214E85F4|nr:uncharacterized protein LOC126481391 [Schistocerca serialis cubense]
MQGGALALLIVGAAVCVLAGAGRPRGWRGQLPTAAAHHIPELVRQLHQTDGPVQLVVDTDAGADDAVALLIALGTPGVSVEAITCANGNTMLDNVVANVLKTLDTAGRLDIPVYAGASQSILETPESDNYFGEDGFGDIEYPNAPDPAEYLQKEHAVDALVRIVSENPGNITLLALAPLTNIALAIRKDPSFIQNVKQVAVLGGSVEGVGNRKPGVEFNIFMDPEAASIVFSSLAENTSESKQVLLTPWETVNMRNYITMDWRKNVLGVANSLQISFLNKIEHYQLEANETYWICADALSAAVLLNPDLITKASSYGVFVEVQGRYGRGAFFVDYAESEELSKNALIVQEINVQSYKEYLLTTLA